MVHSPPIEPALVLTGTVSLARLHGAACWHCGAASRPMEPVGLVRFEADQRVWEVRSCGCRPGPLVFALPSEAAPAMTMRVYRVAPDGTRGPVEREVNVRATEDTVPEPMKFPPCSCPRCVRRPR
ncbi:hypothetical protein [Streptomyces sp. NPDC048057]|uniref:hypothetical protein n=1 Tax=Streptomyces sp. NPDC048057 TaxID=3155628 RepID=UPI0033E8E365